MYPLSSIMTPDPEPDWACVGAAGMPRVRMVTTEGRTFATTAGTDRDFSWEGTDPIGGSAEAVSTSSAKAITRRRRNGIVKKRKRRELHCVVRTFVMGPRLPSRPHCRITALRVKVVERKRGEDRPRPFLLHVSAAYWMAANIS